jgi:phytoene synthase
MTSLSESYAYCRKVAKERAKNFYYSFVLLDEERRNAMCAMYAFMRYCDDLSDEPGANRAAIEGWRRDIESALAGKPADNEIWPAFLDAVTRYKIPHEYFRDMIDGVASDLEPRVIRNFEELYAYCYRVASVVGLLSIEIFGHQDRACREYAVHLGKALQLTNILRDVRSDAERGRIYLPLSELARFQVSPEEILRFEYSPRFRELAASVAARARHFYRQARITLPAVDRRAMVAAELMGSVYWRLLGKLERKQFDVFGPKPTRLNKGQKILLVLRTGLRMASGALTPNYGTP